MTHVLRRRRETGPTSVGERGVIFEISWIGAGRFDRYADAYEPPDQDAGTQFTRSGSRKQLRFDGG